MPWLDQLAVLGQVALAGLLGGVIGFEREWRDKPAGLRTLMFVAAASALFVALGPMMVANMDLETQGQIRTDPIRIVEAIITGISFIGAGTIIFRRNSEYLEGVTTAATILLTAAIGITVALQQYVLAVATTALTLIVLLGMRKVDGFIHRRRHRRKENKESQ